MWNGATVAVVASARVRDLFDDDGGIILDWCQSWGPFKDKRVHRALKKGLDQSETEDLGIWWNGDKVQLFVKKSSAKFNRLMVEKYKKWQVWSVSCTASKIILVTQYQYSKIIAYQL